MSSGRTRYWVSPHDHGAWKVQREGTTRASNVYDNKADAIERARQLAHEHDRSQVLVQRGDGVIQTEWTYGDDPTRYPG